MYKGIKEGGVDFGANLKNGALATRAMKKLTKPIIGSIHGPAAGGGFILALACDYVVAAENSVFSAAFVNIGLVPDCGGLYLMTRTLGINKAVELALTGRSVRAEEARQLGFIAEVVPLDELEAATLKIAQKFVKGPALSYAKIKELLYITQFGSFEDFIPQEVNAQLLCVATDDFANRVCAFVEKH
jgi:trans-2-decenoyl-[acyl-carrier protein] isomerase